MVKVMLYSRAGKRGLRVRFFRRNKYAASLLSEVTNTAKTRIQGSFRAFYMGGKEKKVQWPRGCAVLCSSVGSGGLKLTASTLCSQCVRPLRLLSWLCDATFWLTYLLRFSLYFLEESILILGHRCFSVRKLLIRAVTLPARLIGHDSITNFLTTHHIPLICPQFRFQFLTFLIALSKKKV